MNLITKLARAFRRNEHGSVPVEYAMIAVLISIVAIGVLSSSGITLAEKYAGVLPGLK
jgi:Flp pilus assembly pilin Flp